MSAPNRLPTASGNSTETLTFVRLRARSANTRSAVVPSSKYSLTLALLAKPDVMRVG